MTGSIHSEIPWDQLPKSHYIDNLIYCSQDVFEVEQKTIFSKVWKFVCCESEIAQPYDYRTVTVAGIPLIVSRGSDSTIRAMVNSCSHRGVKLVDQPSGSARRFECLFHHWTYDDKGACVYIPRQQGYESIRLDKAQCGLRQVRCEAMHGLVFVNLDEAASSLRDFLAGSLSVYEDLFGSCELEVFHFHEQVVEANWKHWQETNMEIYHEYLHVLNRKTSMLHPEYFTRAWRPFPNGHMTLDPLIVQYKNMEGSASREEATLPGLRPNEFRLLDIFPDVMINCRASVIRIDTQIPIAPGKTLVQFRGLGVKGEPESVRQKRVRDHAQFWGPFGRNLPEDAIAAERQNETMGRASRYSLIAREEKLLSQDDFPVREFYREWERYTGLVASGLGPRVSPSTPVRAAI